MLALWNLHSLYDVKNFTCSGGERLEQLLQDSVKSEPNTTRHAYRHSHRRCCSGRVHQPSHYHNHNRHHHQHHLHYRHSPPSPPSFTARAAALDTDFVLLFLRVRPPVGELDSVQLVGGGGALKKG